MSAQVEGLIEVLLGDGYVESKYLGVYSIQQFGRQMELSARACAEKKLDRLLVDITPLACYSPTTLERYKIGMMGASVSRGLAKVAVIGTWDQIGTDQFAGTVAQNHGLAVQVFLERDKAISWLLLPSVTRLL